jgi:hypothetical protein
VGAGIFPEAGKPHPSKVCCRCFRCATTLEAWVACICAHICHSHCTDKGGVPRELNWQIEEARAQSQARCIPACMRLGMQCYPARLGLPEPCLKRLCLPGTPSEQMLPSVYPV